MPLFPSGNRFAKVFELCSNKNQQVATEQLKVLENLNAMSFGFEKVN